MKLKSLFAVLLVVFAVSLVEATPGDAIPEQRITCDLVGGVAGDRLCAAHCLKLGYTGGYCNNKKVCVCR